VKKRLSVIPVLVLALLFGPFPFALAQGADGNKEAGDSTVISQQEIASRLLESLSRETAGEAPCPSVGARGIGRPTKGTPQTSSGTALLLDENHVRFNSNSAQPTPDSLRQLRELARALARPEFEGFSFLIIGHTDNRGSEAHNLELSRKRARSVRDYIVKHGPLDPGRINSQGKGEQDPLVQGDHEDAWRKNRRVETRLIPRADVRIVYKRMQDYFERELQPGDTLKSNDRIAFRFAFPDNLYLYIVSKDATGAVTVIFPLEKGDNNRVKRGTKYRVPGDEESWFTLDRNVGRENFFFIASQTPQDEKQLIREIRNHYADAPVRPVARGIVGVETPDRIVDSEKEKYFKNRYDYFHNLFFQHE